MFNKLKYIVASLFLSFGCGGAQDDSVGPQGEPFELVKLEQAVTVPTSYGSRWYSGWDYPACNWNDSNMDCIIPVNAASIKYKQIPVVNDYLDSLRGNSNVTPAVVGSVQAVSSFPSSTSTEIVVTRGSGFGQYGGANILDYSKIFHVSCIVGDSDYPPAGGNGAQLTACKRWNIAIDKQGLENWVANKYGPGVIYIGQLQGVAKAGYRWALAMTQGLSKTGGDERPDGKKRVTSNQLTIGDLFDGKYIGTQLSPCETNLINAATNVDSKFFVNTSSSSSCTD